MLKIQLTRNFEGFGIGDRFGLGEYFFSQNMSKTLTGLTPRWNIESSQNSDNLSGLDTMWWFTQKLRNDLSASDTYGMDLNGSIWKYVTGSWSLAYKPAISISGNGLRSDQKNRLLYAGTRYLGMYDGGDNYITGTVSVTNGSAAVVGTGTAWTSADMIHKRITFSSQAGTWYRVLSVTDATHLTLTANYTGTTNASATHTIYVGWHDGDYETHNGSITWAETSKPKDFGSDISPTTTYTQIETFEDVVLILRGNKICRLNSDDSFNSESTAPFNIPAGVGFVGRAISSNKNGILSGFNIGERSVLVLWDNYSTRSISPWIWLNSNVLAIIPYGANWIVITKSEILLTNGYSTENLSYAVDNWFNNQHFSIVPQGATIVKNWLIIGNSGLIDRRKGGFLILNLKTRLWEYASMKGQMYGVTMGAIFNDSSLYAHVSFAPAYPTKKYIGVLSPSAGNPGVYITPPLGEGSNEKAAEGVKIEMGIDEVSTPIISDFGYNIEVSVCNLTRPLWGYATQKVTATTYNQLTIDGSSYKYAQVGDQVQILQGLNAGEIRTITEITGAGTATEVLTLDRALPNYTEISVFLQLMPFQKISRHTVTNPIEIKDIYFNVKNKIKGKKFLVKVVITDVTAQITPEIRSVGLIYNDLGTI